MKKPHPKVGNFSKIEEFFPLLYLPTQVAQKVKFMFLNVAYRTTVYKTGLPTVFFIDYTCSLLHHGWGGHSLAQWGQSQFKVALKLP